MLSRLAKDRWCDKLWLHWQGIAPDAEEGMDDPDDPREIWEVTLGTIWDKLTLEDQQIMINEKQEIKQAFIDFMVQRA